MSFLFTPAIAKQASIANSANAMLTCDRDAIDSQSYELATVGQARALLTYRSDFWDAFRINQQTAALRNLNLDAEELAEHALARDARNMMAHSILARQYTILGREREAIDAWQRVVDAGGVVVWTATVYDVDYKTRVLEVSGRDRGGVLRSNRWLSE